MDWKNFRAVIYIGIGLNTGLPNMPCRGISLPGGWIVLFCTVTHPSNATTANG
jgi:hypothetical protein